MPAIRLLRWQSNSICLLPEPVTERRPSSRPCSKFATHPSQRLRNDDGSAAALAYPEATEKLVNHPQVEVRCGDTSAVLAGG